MFRFIKSKSSVFGAFAAIVGSVMFGIGTWADRQEPSVSTTYSGDLYESALGLAEFNPFQIVATLSNVELLTIEVPRKSSFQIIVDLTVEAVQVVDSETFKTVEAELGIDPISANQFLGAYVDGWLESGRLLIELKLAGLAEVVPIGPAKPEKVADGRFRVVWSVLPVEGVDTLSGVVTAIDATDPIQSALSGDGALQRLAAFKAEDRPFRVGLKWPENHNIEIKLITPFASLVQQLFFSFFGSTLTLVGAVTLYIQWRNHRREEEALQKKNKTRSRLILPK